MGTPHTRITWSNANIYVTGLLCGEFTGHRSTILWNTQARYIYVLIQRLLEIIIQFNKWLVDFYSNFFIDSDGDCIAYSYMLSSRHLYSGRYSYPAVIWLLSRPGFYRKGWAQNMMASSNWNIFRVTGPLCGEFTGPGEFPAQRPVTRGFDVFFDLRLNKRLSKQPRGWLFETPSWSLWSQCNETNVFQ